MSHRGKTILVGKQVKFPISTIMAYEYLGSAQHHYHCVPKFYFNQFNRSHDTQVQLHKEMNKSVNNYPQYPVELRERRIPLMSIADKEMKRIDIQRCLSSPGFQEEN